MIYTCTIHPKHQRWCKHCNLKINPKRRRWRWRTLWTGFLHEHLYLYHLHQASAPWQRSRKHCHLKMGSRAILKLTLGLNRALCEFPQYVCVLTIFTESCTKHKHKSPDLFFFISSSFTRSPSRVGAGISTQLSDLEMISIFTLNS